jgi:hypothetical protein
MVYLKILSHKKKLMEFDVIIFKIKSMIDFIFYFIFIMFVDYYIVGYAKHQKTFFFFLNMFWKMIFLSKKKKKNVFQLNFKVTTKYKKMS